MKRAIVLSIAVLGLACASLSESVTTFLNASLFSAQRKGAEVEIDGLKSKVPTDWKEEKPANEMRYKQFTIPKAEGDEADGQLVIFKGFGGTTDENIKRWKDSFIPPKGKKIDDVSKVTKMKVAKCAVVMLEISGTYKETTFGPPPKTVERTGYAMLAVAFEAKKENYHIKLTGPAKTIEKHKKGFEEWIKGFE